MAHMVAVGQRHALTTTPLAIGGVAALATTGTHAIIRSSAQRWAGAAAPMASARLDVADQP